MKSILSFLSMILVIGIAVAAVTAPDQDDLKERLTRDNPQIHTDQLMIEEKPIEILGILQIATMFHVTELGEAKDVNIPGMVRKMQYDSVTKQITPAADPARQLRVAALKKASNWLGLFGR